MISNNVGNWILRMLAQKVVCCAVLLVGFCSVSHAFDSVSVEFGTGNRTKLIRLGVQSTWERQWWKSNGSHIGGYWNLTLAQWRGARFQNGAGATQRFMALGITPVFRLQRNDLLGFYGEAGIGLRHLFELYDNNGRQLSTNFQFASQLGAGYVFGNKVDLALKIQHFSNGGFKKPNGGVDFIVARVSYRF